MQSSIARILASSGALAAIHAPRVDRAGGDFSGGITTSDDRAGAYRDLVGDIMAGCAPRGRAQAQHFEGGGDGGYAPRPAPGHSVAYSPFEATGGRRFPIGGFRQSCSGNGATVQATNAPQLPFRGERLVVPSNIAVDFDIVDVKVGQQSEFVAAGSIPALVFSEQGFDVGLRGDTAYIAMTIAITAQNLSSVTKDFAAALIGTTVRGN